MSHGKTICIVDAYSTGAELAPLLTASGGRCIHVQSAADVPAVFAESFRADDFAALLCNDRDEGHLLAELAVFRPDAILAGTETGVRLADRLACALDLPGNDAATSDLRRDKFRMQEALGARGLRSIRQAICHGCDEAESWSERQGTWPIVVKPVESAGGDGVAFCRNVAEIRRAAGSILGQVNQLGLRNEAVLLQVPLLGQQYFVNAVSVDGDHRFTELWRDDRRQVPGAAPICDREELLPYEGDVQAHILSYLREVLTALGIRNGPSHSELIVTPKGPVLIESAARMQGTICHEAVVDALGSSHVTATVGRILDPAGFRRRHVPPYRLDGHLWCVTLQSQRSGTVRRNRCAELLGALPSFHSIIHTPAEGDTISPTHDLFSNPGIIYLRHDDRQRLEADYRKIRQWEACGALFELSE